jgi:hypothetical protein
MTQAPRASTPIGQPPVRRSRPLALALAGAVIAVAVPALAQPGPDARLERQVGPWTPAPPADKPRNATSSAEATEPTAAEQREARKLATAIFAAPSAGQRAADKAAPPSAANVPPAQPKPEWLADDGVHHGGEGLQVKAPF